MLICLAIEDAYQYVLLYGNCAVSCPRILEYARRHTMHVEGVSQRTTLGSAENRDRCGVGAPVGHNPQLNIVSSPPGHSLVRV